MTGCKYPADWDDRRRAVISDHLNRCVNCHQVADHRELEVHHIVPVGQAGTHRESNLVPLCPTCHAAAHRKAMAPRVRWFSNGELSGDEFSAHKELWQGMRDRLGVPRYDPDEDCVYVPVADKERILRQLPT
jgi:5-methylcytosine-specific restriction endonuclease McrA